MKTSLSTQLFNFLCLALAICWFAAAAAKLTDHANFVRQVTSLTGSLWLATFLSYLIPAAQLILFGLLWWERSRQRTAKISVFVLLLMTAFFMYMAFYNPLGGCACIALSKGLGWHSSWLITATVLIINLIALALNTDWKKLQERRSKFYA